MSRLPILASALLLTVSWAFTPGLQSTRLSTKLNVIPPEKQLGVQAPLGYFDPLGLIKNGPYGSPEENFFRYRSVEVKHGRIAMAATLGTLVQQNYHFDGFLSPSAKISFADVPNGLGALKAVPLAGWVQMIVVIGLHEVFIKQREGKAPGDFGTGYFGVSLDDQSSKQLRSLNAELANGRLAMFGILGMWASEIVHSGKPLAEVTF